MTLVMPEDHFRPVLLGQYFASIPIGDLGGNDFSARNVEKVYRGPSGRFFHLLIAAAKPNVYLVIVVDEPAQTIHGHHLLDLNKEYGLSP